MQVRKKYLVAAALSGLVLFAGCNNRATSMAPAPVTEAAAATTSSAPTTTARTPTPTTTKRPATSAAPRPAARPVAPAPVVAPDPVAEAPVHDATYYKNCDAVRAAGAAPIRKGEPGYSSKLDRDGDGIACDTTS